MSEIENKYSKNPNWREADSNGVEMNTRLDPITGEVFISDESGQEKNWSQEIKEKRGEQAYQEHLEKFKKLLDEKVIEDTEQAKKDLVEDKNTISVEAETRFATIIILGPDNKISFKIFQSEKKEETEDKLSLGGQEQLVSPASTEAIEGESDSETTYTTPTKTPKLIISLDEFITERAVAEQRDQVDVPPQEFNFQQFFAEDKPKAHGTHQEQQIVIEQTEELNINTNESIHQETTGIDRDIETKLPPLQESAQNITQAKTVPTLPQHIKIPHLTQEGTGLTSEKIELSTTLEAENSGIELIIVEQAPAPKYIKIQSIVEISTLKIDRSEEKIYLDDTQDQQKTPEIKPQEAKINLEQGLSQSITLEKTEISTPQQIGFEKQAKPVAIILKQEHADLSERVLENSHDINAEINSLSTEPRAILSKAPVPSIKTEEPRYETRITSLVIDKIIPTKTEPEKQEYPHKEIISQPIREVIITKKQEVTNQPSRTPIPLRVRPIPAKPNLAPVIQVKTKEPKEAIPLHTNEAEKSTELSTQPTEVIKVEEQELPEHPNLLRQLAQLSSEAKKQQSNIVEINPIKPDTILRQTQIPTPQLGTKYFEQGTSVKRSSPLDLTQDENSNASSNNSQTLKLAA